MQTRKGKAGGGLTLGDVYNMKKKSRKGGLQSGKVYEQEIE